MVFYKDDKNKLIVEPTTKDEKALVDCFIQAMEVYWKSKDMSEEEIDAEISKITKVYV